MGKLRVPGIAANNLKLEATADHVLLHLEKDGRVEKKQFVLPDEISNPADLEAVCANGLLQLGFPTPTTHKPQLTQIEVQAERPSVSVPSSVGSTSAAQ